MNKYIIKNCPALRGWVCNEHFMKQDEMLDCQDCTDCFMKQIVSHCKETINTMCADCGSNPYAMGRDLEARLILQKFEIQEVE